jgi:hypothetical protein
MWVEKGDFRSDYSGQPAKIDCTFVSSYNNFITPAKQSSLYPPLDADG